MGYLIRRLLDAQRKQSMKQVEKKGMRNNALALAGVLFIVFSLALPASAHASAAADEELATAKLLAQKMSLQMRAEFSYRLNQLRYLKGYHVDDLSDFSDFAGSESGLTGNFASGSPAGLTQGNTQKVSRPNFDKAPGKGDSEPNLNKPASKAAAQANGSATARLGSAPSESVNLNVVADSRAVSAGESRAPATSDKMPGAASPEASARSENAGIVPGEASEVGHALRDGSYANLVKDEKPEFFRAVEDGKRAATRAMPEDPLRDLVSLPKPQGIARLKKDKSMRELMRERFLSGDFDDDPADLLEQFRQLLSSVDASAEGLNQSGLSLFDVVHQKYLEKAPAFRPHGGMPGKK
jgi:hypothetical protein